MAQHLGLTACEGQRHQLIAAGGFTHPQPTLALRINQAIGVAPTLIRGSTDQRPGLRTRAEGDGVGDPAAGLNKDSQLAAGTKQAPTKFMDPAAQTPAAWSEILRCGPRRHLAHQGGAATLVGAVLSPEQLLTQQQRLFAGAISPHHLINGQGCNGFRTNRHGDLDTAA